MSLWKKAVSVGTSAALVASLLATVAAPAVFAANTSAGGGTIYPGAGSSATFSLTFAEDAVGQFSNGSFAVDVADSAGVNGNATFVTTVAPTITRNAGLGTASAGFIGDQLVVNVGGTDPTKIDSWTISGLKVSAGAAAAFGSLIFSVSGDIVGLSQALSTASGTTTSVITGGSSTSFTYALDAGSVQFQPTGTACTGSALAAGSVTVAAAGVVAAETFTAIAPTGVANTIYKATALTGSKPVGTVVTQSVCANRFPSPVTVGDAVDAFNQWGWNPTFQAGVNSQNPADIEADLGFFDGLLLAGDTVTFTIQTPGVLFAPDPELTGDIFSVGIGTGTPVLSADRKSISVALTADATAGDYIDFGPYMDVAQSVANGTTVDVAVTTSRAGVVVLGSPVTVAVVGFVSAGSTAAPIIYIGQNDQSTGMVTLTESAPGVISDAGNLSVCLQSGESWAIGRYFWAVVTSGDLKFNVAGLPASQAKMTINGNCLDVLPYTGSSVASTIEIRDGTATAPAASGATNGPKVNVPNYMTPGQTYVRVYNDGTQVADNIVIAVRAYTGTPTATASAQLPVIRGMLNQAAGSITFTEGAPNQFGSYYYLELCLVYPSTSYEGAYIWSSPTGANAPVVTTNSTVSGLIATFDPVRSGDGCIWLNTTDSGLSGLGTITVSNLKLDVKTDAQLGPVFVRIYTNMTDRQGEGLLQATVSPATVVAPRALSIGAVSALGANPTSGYSTKTPKVQTAGKYITWKFTGGKALAGQRVNVLKAVRINGAWGGPSYLKSAWADANGIVTVVMKASAGTVLNLRVQWPGGGVYTVSTSKALGGAWK